MNHTKKGLFDRFWLALGTAATAPPSVAMPTVHSGRFAITWNPRLETGESGPEIDGARDSVGWAT